MPDIEDLALKKAVFVLRVQRSQESLCEGAGSLEELSWE